MSLYTQHYTDECWNHDDKIIDQFAAIGELFAGSERNINDLRDKLSETKSALETTYQNSQKEVTKSLNEFNLIFRSSQERGSLGEYRVEQLLENLGLQENVHWKSQQSYGSARPDYTFYFPDQVYINLDSNFMKLLSFFIVMLNSPMYNPKSLMFVTKMTRRRDWGGSGDNHYAQAPGRQARWAHLRWMSKEIKREPWKHWLTGLWIPDPSIHLKWSIWKLTQSV